VTGASPIKQVVKRSALDEVAWRMADRWRRLADRDQATAAIRWERFRTYMTALGIEERLTTRPNRTEAQAEARPDA
jgi:hypothetical protein